MAEPEQPLEEIYLQPGEMCIRHEPAILRTLLGSCVGVTFWSQRLGIGALCHAMLPNCPLNAFDQVAPKFGYRYVDYAIRDLARQFDSFGVLRSEVQVKLFGGADVLLTSESELSNTVGKINCDTAIALLRTEGYEIAASCLRGTTGVNIRFNTANGEVHLRRLQQADGFAGRAPRGAGRA